jgi:hypothetical protein
MVRATISLGLDERDVIGSTNISKFDNVSKKRNAQICGDN